MTEEEVDAASWRQYLMLGQITWSNPTLIGYQMSLNVISIWPLCETIKQKENVI